MCIDECEWCILNLNVRIQFCLPPSAYKPINITQVEVVYACLQ